MRKSVIGLWGVMSLLIAGCSTWYKPTTNVANNSGPHRTIAQSGGICPQQESAFSSIAADLRACKDPLYPDQAKCNSFCSRADGLLGGGGMGGVQGCSESDLQNARSQGQQDVLRDLSVRASVQTGLVYGTTEEECRRRVNQAVSSSRQSIINQCNSQARVIRNCDVVAAPRITVSQGRVPSIQGTARYTVKAKGSTDDTCKAQAIELAKQDGLNKCRQLTGYECQVSSAAPIASSKVDKEVFGDDKRKCDATVFIEAAADVVYQCQASLEAQNQARPATH